MISSFKELFDKKPLAVISTQPINYCFMKDFNVTLITNIFKNHLQNLLFYFPKPYFYYFLNFSSHATQAIKLYDFESS